MIPSRPSRWRGGLTVAGIVLAAHAALLLERTLPSPGPERRADGPRPVRVRQILITPAPDVPAAAPAVRAVLPAPGTVRVRPRPPRHGAHAAVAPEPAWVLAATAPAGIPAPAAHAASGLPLPVYGTRLPPAITLRYAVREGASDGRAELRWRPDEGRYQLALDSVGAGGQRRGSVSQGGLDANGVVPERYTEGRRGRESRAVNFQRDAGRITFSASSLDFPLQPGAQDRLSWMLQLPAVIEAEPALREPGAEVLMFVVGARGDAEVWVFTVLGREAVETGVGPAAGTLHLRRQSQRPYDTQVDVWLDPARHHLPVRLQLQLQPARSGVEFVLTHDTPP